MIIDVLGYLALFLSWTGLYLCKKREMGWAIMTLVWFLWFPYGILIGSYPVVLNTSVYAIISAINWRRVRKDKSE